MTDSTQPPVRTSKYLPPGPATVPGPSTAAVRGRPSGTRRTGPSSHSPRAGKLPDGRELFIRKPNLRRNWEPVRDHFCESCGGLYPRTPFDWEDVGFKEDGKKLSALRKRCSGCTFPGLTQKLESDRSKAVEGYIRRLHPSFNLPVQLQARPPPVNQNHRNLQGHQVNNINLSQLPQPGSSQRFVQIRPTFQPLNMRPQESLIPPSGRPPVPPAQTSTQAMNQRVGTLAPVSQPFPVFATAQSPAGPSRTSPRKPVLKAVPTPPPASKPSTPRSSTPKLSTPKPSTPKITPTQRSQPTQPSSEMFEALRRAFDRNPDPSPDVLELLAVTFNITDVRVLGELFKVWRQQGKKTPFKDIVKGKDFEPGSLEMNDQGTPDLSFGNGGGFQGDTADDLRRQEQETLQRIGMLESEGMERDAVQRQELGPNSGVEDGEIVEILDEPVSLDTADSPQNTTIAPRSSPPMEDLSELRSNGLLDMLTSDDAMQVDEVEASDVRPDRTQVRSEPENGTISGQSEVEHRESDGASKQGNDAVDEAMQVIIPGMNQAPSSTGLQFGTDNPVSELETPTGGAQVIIKNINHIQTTSTRSPSVPTPALTLQPQPTSRPPPTFTGPPTRPLPSANRPKEGVTIIDCPVHAVKHMSDPVLQRAYEIFTAPEPTRLANWLSVVFKPASEKYSVMQKDVYTEYKSLFEGSAEPCATGQQVVRMCVDIWPELKLGKRPDQPAQFRMWGLYRVRVYSGSPWEALYNGQLKQKLGLSNAKPIEMAASESGVLRVGAPVDSLASALSMARLDQGKMKILSDRANAKSLESCLKGFPIADSLPTWQTKTTPRGAAVTTHRLSKLNKVYKEPVVRSKRQHPELSAKKEVLRIKRIINPPLSNSNPSNGNSQPHAVMTQEGPSSTMPVHWNAQPSSGGPVHLSHTHPNAPQTTATQYQHRAPAPLPPQSQQYQRYPNGQNESWQYANPPPFPQPR